MNAVLPLWVSRKTKERQLLTFLAFISTIDRSAKRCHACIPSSLLVTWYRRYTILHRARELTQIPDPRANGCQVIYLGFKNL